MNFTNIFKSLNETLVSKKQSELSDVEKNALANAYMQILFQHVNMTENRTDLSLYAKNKTLQSNLANITFDVLKQTRAYGQQTSK